MYPARFYFTYPLAFVGGLVGMYALRSEMNPEGGQLLAAIVTGAVGLFAGWDIAQQHEKLAEGKEAKPRVSILFVVTAAMTLYFIAREQVGSETILWFCSLGFACLPIGFAARVVHHHRKTG